MSDGINRVSILGNLGADPELRFTQGGQAVLNMRVAATTSYKPKDGERKETTEWYQITVWGPRGEGLSKILSKGDRVYVEGEGRTSTYEKEGQKHYKFEVNAKEVVLCGGKNAEHGRGEEREERAPSREPGRDDHRAPARDDRRSESRSSGRRF